jgi:hypothetical protein
MGKVATFFAIVKCYTALNVLLLPRSFVNGGYLLSPAAMLVAVFFEGLCAVRLANAANKYKIFSYPAIAMKALGPLGYNILRVFLALGHIQFTIGQLSFTMQSLSSTL